MAPETMAPETMAPETLVPEEIAQSNPKALGLTISMASVRYLRRCGNKCQRGSGLGVCRARRYAQRRVAQKRAAGLLLTSVGLARLQGGMAKGGQGSGEAPRACGGGAQRKACAGGGGANPRMHIIECLLRQALSNASEDA